MVSLHGLPYSMVPSEQSDCLLGGSELQAQVLQLGRNSYISFYVLASEVIIGHFYHTLFVETVTKAGLILMGGNIDPTSLFNNVKLTFYKTRHVVWEILD